MIGTTQLDVLAATPQPTASGTGRPSQWLVDAFGGSATQSGERMNTQRALSYSAVFQAISVLAGDIGQLPLDLYEREDDRNKIKAREHPAYRLTRKRANPYMSAGTFRETMMLYVLIYGNGVAEIEWSPGRQPIALWPLLPDRTRREIDNSGQLWYITRIGNGTTAVEERKLRPENVVHISNFGADGTWGYPTITLARNSWGLGLAGEQYANTYFKNGGTPSGVLETDRVLEEPEYNRLSRSWRDMHEGLDNAARVAILEQNMKYTPISFSQKDSQWLESRGFQKEEVASWFNLPPHKLGILDDANYSNMVEAERHYLSTGLMRWEVKWQDEYDFKLLPESEKKADSHFFEFNNDAILRGDLKTRYEAYTAALGGHPFMEINEVRGRENLNAVEGGDEIPKPLNMAGNEEDGGDDGENTATAKIRELLTCEANRVCHAAKSAANFVGWLDSFYDRWKQAVAEAVPRETVEYEGRQVGVIPSYVQVWIGNHKEECLEAAGEVSEKEQLVARLAAVTAAWSGRAEQYAESMKGYQS